MLAEGAACPAHLGQGQVTGSLSSALSKPKSLSLCQMCKGGTCRKLLCLGARGLGMLRHNLLFSGRDALTQLSVSSCRRRRRSH